MDPDKDIFFIFHIAVNQCQMLLRVNLGAIGFNGKFAVGCGEPCAFPGDNKLFMVAAVRDKIRHSSPFEPVFFAEFIQLRHTRHGAVGIHDLADDTGRFESGKTGQIHSRLSVSGAAKDASRTGDQWERMSGGNQ